MRFLLLLAFLFPFTTPLLADEGMWLPILLKQLNIKDMQAKGFKLSAEDVYSVNQASLKDAVVIFGRGCTGGVVSAEGLVLTNHHCAYGNIQALSSVENDYLTHGYRAKNRAEELPCPGLTVRFLEYMEDVTEAILQGVSEKDSDSIRREKIQNNRLELVAARQAAAPKLTYDVDALYYGNQYFLYAYRIYRDVRLVVAPPSSIGKFGGDTDNWMWPRHTGDFSLLRIYADSQNEPAEYSPDNVPMRPRKHFTISTKGVQPNDFAMVFGYPGSTERYIVSQAVEEVMNRANPRKIALRDVRLATMGQFMSANDTIRIKYASKHASVANSWKRWRGEANGLRRLDAVALKQQQEANFAQWVKSKRARQREYGHLLPAFQAIYAELEPLNLARDYYLEALRGIEAYTFAVRLASQLPKEGDDQLLEEETAQTIHQLGQTFFTDYDPRVDRQLMEQMLEAYRDKMPDSLKLPTALAHLNTPSAIERHVENAMRNSLLTDSLRFRLWVEKDRRLKTLENDPLYPIVRQLQQEYESSVLHPKWALEDKLDALYRLYVKGLREMAPEAKYFPDANFTMRVAYGSVEGYESREAVHYGHQTTLDGVMEKVAIGAHDYVVPERLTTMYKTKDYGRWAVNGTVPACFAASIHTTGGNSGSPALNAYGELIGLNFDRVWEGTMSDILFDPEKCRNIMVDIRYVLFIIDRYFDAGYLLNEMTLRE